MPSDHDRFAILAPDDPRTISRQDDLALAAALVGETPLDDVEVAGARDDILRFCAEHPGDDTTPSALYRECLAGHLTGSAFVVDATGTRTLLLHHGKLGLWLQPGGHADGDGNLAAVALREAEEETGIEGLRVVVPAIDIDIHAIPARPGEPAHLHHDLRFLVLAPPDAVVTISDESRDARWATVDDPDIAGSEELTRAVTRALAVAATLID
ncbi:MAG: NUDIX domain-containing protein [Actinomycetota bacterium]